MASLKRIWYFAGNLYRNQYLPFPRSKTQALTILLLTVALFFFFSDTNTSPAVTSVTLSSRFHSASTYASSLSSVVSSNTSRKPSRGSRNYIQKIIRDITSCDIYDGRWVFHEESDQFYKPGSCPYVGDSFNCFKNGRPDSDFLKFRWKPHGCKIPRFSGVTMLKMLKGKRLVLVGDSLNRNMWESLVCSLRESLNNKSKVFEVSGRRDYGTQGFYSFRFKDYNCSVDFIKSPFLVQEWKIADKAGTRREVLRLDMIHESSSYYQDADIIIFNTGHWWTHTKTYKGNNYFQEGDRVYKKLEVKDAYTRALKTWAQWVDSNINPRKTRILFRGYSASHFRGGQWNSGGSCDGEMMPITNETYLSRYPWMMKILESVMSEMKTPVVYMNITKMTDYRKDGHPSVFREVQDSGAVQDCSHWCLPGVPDSWNQLLYATLLTSLPSTSLR